MSGLASRGAVIIPAHNEEAVIANTLEPLSAAAASGLLEVIVVANGCSDQTAATARSWPGIRVREVGASSKAGALNTGDSMACSWPRLYLDADIETSLATVLAVFDELGRGDILAARPEYRYDLDNVSWTVRAYYRARQRMPVMSSHLWGAGAYALGSEGHERLGNFPALTADDAIVDALFSRSEKAIVACDPVRVRVPRTSAALLTTLRRVYAGAAEATTTSTPPEPVGGLGIVLASVRGPASLVDAVVYCSFALAGRILSHRSSGVWLRDSTTRATGQLEPVGDEGAAVGTFVDHRHSHSQGTQDRPLRNHGDRPYVRRAGRRRAARVARGEQDRLMGGSVDDYFGKQS